MLLLAPYKNKNYDKEVLPVTFKHYVFESSYKFWSWLYAGYKYDTANVEGAILWILWHHYNYFTSSFHHKHKIKSAHGSFIPKPKHKLTVIAQAQRYMYTAHLYLDMFITQHVKHIMYNITLLQNSEK